MKFLLAILCFVLAHVGVWSSKLQNSEGEDLTPEEPHPVFVADPDDMDLDPSSLSIRQKAFLHHPKIQHMLKDIQMKDLKAYAEDSENEDVLQWVKEGLPLGFVHPEALAQWGINWKDLDNAQGDHEDEEKAYQEMEDLIWRTLDKYNDKHQEPSSKTKTEASGHTMWHPMATFQTTVQANGGDLSALVEEDM